MSISHAEEEKRVDVTFFNVGYADTILVGVSGGQQYLIDAGGTILNHLQELGVDALDAVVLTHGDLNHFQNLHELLGVIPIKEVIINNRSGLEPYTLLLEQLSQFEIPVSLLDDGQRDLPLSETAMLKLYCHVDPILSRNDNSIQSYVEDLGSTLWLTSDIGTARQDYYLSRYPHFKEADVLQVPHHGDQISENMKELFHNKPAIVSTGTNEWGLPDLPTLNAWQAPLFRTDQDGSIRLTADGEGWLISGEKP